jgi:hypothetical protein
MIGLAWVILISSCSSEIQDSSNSKSDKAQLVLAIPADLSSMTAESMAESLIKNLTVFVFDAQTGHKEYSVRVDIPLSESSTEVDMSQWETSGIIKLLEASILADLSKIRNIHVVANVAEGKLDAVSTESQLDSIVTDAISSDIPNPDEDHPILMQGNVNNHVFASDASASISLVRNIAKVKMTINTTDYTFGGKNILLLPESESMAVRAYNCADRSFVVPAPLSPQGLKYFTGEAFLVSPSSRENTKTQSVTTSYINENLRNSYSKDSTVTSFVIQVPYQIEDGTVRTDNYYRVLVNQDNGYRINRNTIYDLTVNISKLGGQTDASAPLIECTLKVLPWDQTTVYSDISQTFLTIQQTSVSIGAAKNFYYQTNASASECFLETGASWLSAVYDGTNNIKLTASGDGYTGSRSTTFTIKVKNLSKVITVNQAPEPVISGSVALAPRAVYLSEVAQAKNADLDISPSSANWLMIAGNQSVASCIPSSGTGSTQLSFARGASYGNTYFKFANLATMEYDSVKVCHLYLSITSETLAVPGSGGSYTEPVTVLGGDVNWYIKSKPDWVTPATNSNGQLAFTVTPEPNEQERSGSIVIAHVNDPTYTKVLNISQSPNYIRFADFDYLLISYDWSNSTGKDLDTGTEFRGTGVSKIDSQPVGWSLNSSISDANSKLILAWGGDNRASAGSENIVVYMGNLLSSTNLTSMRNNGIRYIYIDLYATWFGTKDYSSPIKLKMKSYIGGTMVKSSVGSQTNAAYGTYTNSGGVLDVNWEGERQIVTYQGVSAFRTNYTKMGVIRYDIEKNEAVATIESNSSSSVAKSSVLRSVDIPMLSGETKDEYGKRLRIHNLRKTK